MIERDAGRTARDGARPSRVGLSSSAATDWSGPGTSPARSAFRAGTQSSRPAPRATASWAACSCSSSRSGSSCCSSSALRLARIASVQPLELDPRPDGRAPPGRSPRRALDRVQFGGRRAPRRSCSSLLRAADHRRGRVDVRYHHLQHAGQFLVGAAVGAASRRCPGLRAAPRPVLVGIARRDRSASGDAARDGPRIYGPSTRTRGCTALPRRDGGARHGHRPRGGDLGSSPAGSCSCSRSAWR